ncbi:MAG: ACP S-malonyltransferase [Planctomycetes bacterium]|nr:ACP S-malonyltransferase [Planctomycetota bacterium]
MSDSLPAILLCPGQGAQHVGMGRSWAQGFDVAKKTFEEADRILGFSLSGLCFNGPEDQLGRTDVAQPAIFTASVACHRALQSLGKIGEVRAAAGLSLGEFTALHLAGAMDFESGLKLVRLRGQFMQEAADSMRTGDGPAGGMTALIGADEAQAGLICEQTLEKGGPDEVLVPANFNCPGQIVISGSIAACLRAVDVASAMGVRATALKVAGAFHSPMMKPAAARLAEALERVAWKTPTVPVVSNVTARPHDLHDAASIRRLLVEQLTSPVRWEQSMVWMIENLPGRNIELAPGKTLSGMMRRIDKAVKVENYAEAPSEAV